MVRGRSLLILVWVGVIVAMVTKFFVEKFVFLMVTSEPFDGLLCYLAHV